MNFKSKFCLKVKRLGAIAIVIILTAVPINPVETYANDSYSELSSKAIASDIPIAFPGADGAGRFATGGRGGTVVHVTNLNDSGAGSFRDAVSGSNRIVVFDVGGTINLKSDVSISGNVTVMGQTAPGGAGITLRNGKIAMGGDNTIVRYISSRPGEKGKESDYDAWGGSKGSNSIIDHCSLGWANDEQFGLYSNNMNMTVQYTIIGPANCVSYHSKGSHGFGAMFGKGYNSWHHNLLCHSMSRNFRGKVIGTNPMDFVNNVVYDWGGQTAYGTFGHINYANNYFKAGPSTKGSYRYAEISSGTDIWNYKFYLTGNKMVNKDDSVRSDVTKDNWKGFDYGSGTFLYYRSTHPFPIMNNGVDTSVMSTAESADDAYQNVLSFVGSGVNAAARPKIDAQVVEETRTGTGSLTGGRDFSTVTDSAVKSAISSYGIKYMNYDEYYPAAITKNNIIDSDNDGMPDDWEIARGLNPNDKSDANGKYLGGFYTNIEHYCNDLTINSFSEGTVTKSPTLSELGYGYEKASADMNAIKLSKSKIAHTSDLTLPTEGSIHDSSITWRSASDNIKIENNQISEIKRSENEDVKTNLIASITNGNCSMDAYFTITVVGLTTKWFASSSNNGAAAGSKLMTNLTPLFTASYGTLAASASIDGTTYTGYISSSVNGSYSDGQGSGTCLKYTAASDGILTAYAGDIGYTEGGNNKIFYIVPEGVNDYKTECIASTDGKSGTTQKLNAAVESGKTYYIFVAGSKGHLIGVKFTENSKISAPEPTPYVTSEKWDFNNSEVSTSFQNNAAITNKNGGVLTAVYKSASGTPPTIRQRSGSNNYLNFTYGTSGQDGYIYTPKTPMDGEKIIFEFDFNKSDIEKDTSFLRVFDPQHATPDNTYTTSTDGRFFELKSGVGEHNNLVITDYFSAGRESTSDNPKGLDIGISDISYKAGSWYSLKLEYYKDSTNRHIIDVYSKASGNYVLRDTVILGTGTLKSGTDLSEVKLTPAKVQFLGRKASGVTCGIDNICFSIQNDAEVSPTSIPIPSNVPPTSSPAICESSIVYSFTQNDTNVSEFSDGKLVCNIYRCHGIMPESYSVIAAQYDQNENLIDISQNICSGETQIIIDVNSDASTIKVFSWEDLTNAVPLGNYGEIQRK